MKSENVFLLLKKSRDVLAYDPGSPTIVRNLTKLCLMGSEIIGTRTTNFDLFMSCAANSQAQNKTGLYEKHIMDARLLQQ